MVSIAKFCAIAFPSSAALVIFTFDNGCIWLGVWSQGGKGIERMITLDVALTSCKYAGLDRRYTGSFLLAVPDSSAQVSLLVYTPPIPGQKVLGYSLGGTLRRH